jgi:hypothetical protein
MSSPIGQIGSTPNTLQIAQGLNDSTNQPLKPGAQQPPQKPNPSGSTQGVVPKSALEKAVGGVGPVSTQVRIRATFNNKGVDQTTRVQVKIPQDKNNAVLLQGTSNSKNVLGARVGFSNITKLNPQLTLESEIGAGIKTNGFNGIDGSVGVKGSSGNFSASLTAEGAISNQGNSVILNPEIGVKLSDSVSLNAGREQSLTNPGESFNYAGVALDINKDAALGFRFDDKGNIRVESKLAF